MERVRLPLLLYMFKEIHREGEREITPVTVQVQVDNKIWREGERERKYIYKGNK